jgi:anhydro-N-acetylmuramic acid kinase
MNWTKKLSNLQNRKSLVVAGAMSGTSADGIDVAICKFSGPPEELTATQCVFSSTYQYPASLQKKIRSVKTLSIEDVSQIHFEIGRAFAEALIQAEKDSGLTFDISGSHGQTVYHHSGTTPIKTTLQLGCGDVISRMTNRPCIHDFRAKDIVCGGEGAPLTPATDFFLFRSKDTKRAILNLGGIANITVFGESLVATRGFDTGPANAPLDRLVRIYTNNREPYDTDGKIAARATVNAALLERLLAEDSFLKKAPPKSAGFENYGDDFVAKLQQIHGKIDEDLIATTTRFVVESIVRAIKSFIPTAIDELLVAGGGARNLTVMRWLQELLPVTKVKNFSEVGVPDAAREAMAFSFLAYLFIHSYALNLSGITGARTESILGKLSIP